MLQNSNREFEFGLCYFSSLVDMMPLNLYPTSDPRKWVFRVNYSQCNIFLKHTYIYIYAHFYVKISETITDDNTNR